ncbi:MerR family transcriptional regulator [Pseudogemmobacter bohemicus]|uniref:MerR family transcriptional regulator n=1 Tax=Pseudogemmobacter bohemicus TaxID=2250708 RepID=UPI000DD3C357|nr:MerR family transcriptional regulator [Pseudogemmobacter bohemicus]
MGYTVTTIGREFSPKEAAEVTGVSVSVQRDWRRRGILAERQGDGWTVFDLNGIVELMIIKMLSASGFSLTMAKSIAGLSLLPMHREFGELEGAFEFEGDEMPESIKQRILFSRVHGAENSRYLVAPLPPSDNFYGSVFRCGDLNYITDRLSEDGSFHCLIIDHRLLADAVKKAVDGPLYRIVSELKEENTPDAE